MRNGRPKHSSGCVRGVRDSGSGFAPVKFGIGPADIVGVECRWILQTGLSEQGDRASKGAGCLRHGAAVEACREVRRIGCEEFDGGIGDSVEVLG